MEAVTLLKVVCSDKGQHPQRLLGKLGHDDRFGDALVIQSGGRHKGSDKPFGVDATSVVPAVAFPQDGAHTRPTLRFTCSTCGRSPRVMQAKLQQIIAAGVSVLDISALPF